MRPEATITCPNCDHRFKPLDRCWYVCHECLTIIGPDDSMSRHKEEECVKRLGSSLRCYSEAEARHYQAIEIEARRESPINNHRIQRYV